MNSSARKPGNDRQPSVAGSFYPAKEKELRETMKELFRGPVHISQDAIVRALIVPHAGYVYSGEVAAAGFLSIPENQEFDNIFIIGSSHKVSFAGASVYSPGDYITPLGRVEVNRHISDQLIDQNDLFSYYPPAHIDEHSLEVQLPFIQHRFGKGIKIVPIVLGTSSKSVCSEIAEILRPWFVTENLFIISSDFSHYPSYDDAVRIDQATADALMSGSSLKFSREINKKIYKDPVNLSTRMCGWTSAMTLLALAEGDNRLNFRHITYSNSGDSRFGDHERVVGYHAIALVISEDNTNTAMDRSPETEILLTEEEGVILLNLARESIKSHLFKNSSSVADLQVLTPGLGRSLGAFVTITLNDKLRGCIGRFSPSQPLWEVVKELAISAAFNDSRFTPVTIDDLSSMKIEISVLSSLRKIDNIDEIELGKHGVYIKKGLNSGTFLPKVAENKSWSVEEFLGRISRDKAGLGWNGWMEAEIYTYEAITFSEK